MSFYAAAALINAITSLALGFFVFLKNRRNPTNTGFILLSASVFIWSIFYFMWQISSNHDTALLYTRLLSIGSTMVPLFYLQWVLSFLGVKSRKNAIVLFLGYVATIIFLSFSFSPLFIKGVERAMVFNFWPKAGTLYSVYLLISYAGLVGYGLVQLFKSYVSDTGLKRYQIKYIIFGTIIGFFGGATNFFLWYDIPILPVGNIVVSLYVFILFYAMIKYRLMDVRVIARKIFVYFGIAAFTYAFFYFLIWMYNYVFGGLFTTASYVTGVVVAPLFVIVFYAVDREVKNFANKYLFVSLYNYQETINKLIDELVSYIDLDKIIDLIASAIKKAMQLDKANIFLLSADGGYNLFRNSDHSEVSAISNKFIINYLLRYQKPVIREELIALYANSKNEQERRNFLRLREYMDKISASVCLPLIANKELIGIIVLGVKISGDPYTKEDLELLNVLSKQAGVAIENALQYKQIQEFGATLQEKVDEQTKDIKKKNMDLLKLASEEAARKEEAERISKSKTEFISIASHQLRTPLAAVRGYTSMLKSGDYGKISKDAMVAVDYIYESSVRMIKLVNSLLSVSRLEKGQVELKIQEVSIGSIIEDCIKDVKLVAKDKGLYLKYIKPKNELPMIKGDPDKLKEAFNNLINNAVLYTLTGGVTVSSEVKGGNIVVKIKDTGIGIEKEEFEKIFESFSRGKAGTELYTQGTGLGLYVAKNFLQMHKGNLTAESEGKDKGSTFIIELPINSTLESRHDFVLTET